jgi:hypothetical protein
MAIPSTGTDWETGGFNDIDSRLFLRGGRQAVLIRQARGTTTDMSPTNWSPFALDGTLRDDLFAVRRVGGFWTPVGTANEGFWLFGAFKEGNGPSEESKLTKDDFMVEQLNYAYDSDIIKEDTTIKATPVETMRPFLKRIRHNLPLMDDSGNLLVEDVGASNAFWGTPIDTDPVEWQLLTLHARRIQGQTIVNAKGYPLCKVVDKGNSKMDKKDSDASELTFEPVPDGIMVAQDGITPIIFGEWVAGPGWTALGGVPIVGTAPTGASVGSGSGKATLTTPDPTGGDGPFAIVAQSTIDNGVTWLTAPLDNPGAITSASGTTTVKVKSVAAGSTKFRLQVTGTNGAVSNTVISAAITIT